MATPAQCDYLRTLWRACAQRGIELPAEVEDKLRDVTGLSNEEAGEIINDLKFELGWK